MPLRRRRRPREMAAARNMRRPRSRERRSPRQPIQAFYPQKPQVVRSSRLAGGQARSHSRWACKKLLLGNRTSAAFAIVRRNQFKKFEDDSMGVELVLCNRHRVWRQNPKVTTQNPNFSNGALEHSKNRLVVSCPVRPARSIMQLQAPGMRGQNLGQKK